MRISDSAGWDAGVDIDANIDREICGEVYSGFDDEV